MQTSEQFKIQMLEMDVKFLFGALWALWILVAGLAGAVIFLLLER